METYSVSNGTDTNCISSPLNLRSSSIIVWESPPETSISFRKSWVKHILLQRGCCSRTKEVVFSIECKLLWPCGNFSKILLELKQICKAPDVYTFSTQVLSTNQRHPVGLWFNWCNFQGFNHSLNCFLSADCETRQGILRSGPFSAVSSPALVEGKCQPMTFSLVKGYISPSALQCTAVWPLTKPCLGIITVCSPAFWRLDLVWGKYKVSPVAVP